MRKISGFLLIFSLFLGHYPNIVLNELYGINIRFYLYDVVIFIFFIFSFFIPKYRNRTVDAFFLFFIFINIIILLLNTKYFLSLSAFLYLFRFCVYILSYPFLCYVFRNIPTPRIYISLFLFFHLIVFYLFPNVIIAGYDPHMNRLYGPFIDPNYYSVFLVLILIYIFSYKFDFVNAFNIFLTLFSIFLTYSRWGIVLCLMLLAFLIVKKRLLYFFPLFFIVVFILITSTPYLYRFLLIEGNHTSFFYRVLSYIEGAVILGKSIIPLGYNNIFTYKNYLTSNENSASSYTDSFILNILLFGGLLFIGFYFLLIKRMYFFNKDLYLYIFFIVLSSFVINVFFHPYFLVILALLLGISVLPKKP